MKIQLFMANRLLAAFQVLSQSTAGYQILVIFRGLRKL